MSYIKDLAKLYLLVPYNLHIQDVLMPDIFYNRSRKGHAILIILHSRAKPKI
jgi:hypothetical protein